MGTDWSGWISGQIGASLDAITAAVERDDPMLVANHLRNMISNCYPIIKQLDEEKQKAFAIPPMIIPPKKKGVPDAEREREAKARLFEDCMRIKGELLVIISQEADLYMRAQKPFDGSTNGWAAGHDDAAEAGIVQIQEDD